LAPSPGSYRLVLTDRAVGVCALGTIGRAANAALTLDNAGLTQEPSTRAADGHPRPQPLFPVPQGHIADSSDRFGRGSRDCRFSIDPAVRATGVELPRFRRHLDTSGRKPGKVGTGAENEATVSRGVPARRDPARPAWREAAAHAGEGSGDLRCHVAQLWLKEEKAAKGERPGGLSQDEREELQRLRDENATLRMKREILRNAAVFFAREGDGR